MLDTITMSAKELKRYDIIKMVLFKKLSQVNAAALLQLSARQVRRLRDAVIKNGAKGLIHKNRGKESPNKLSDSQRKMISDLLHEKYYDFNAHHATDMLRDNHGIKHDPKTIQSIMLAEGLHAPKKKKHLSEFRQWRQPRSCYGELVQFDGSYHNWLGAEAGEICLLLTVDDATSMPIHGKFDSDEGLIPVMGYWQEYMSIYGKPLAIYTDKFSTYKMNHKMAIGNPDTKTQFGRALETLRVEVIFANSPQAKGRVENKFKTFQDRLIKELRLAGIKTIEEANRFLNEKFIPNYCKRFGKKAAKEGDLHRPLTAMERKQLPAILSRHETRVVQNDFTIGHNSTWFQISKRQCVTICKGDKITVQERIDGTAHFTLRGKELSVSPIAKRGTKGKIPWIIHATQKDPVLIH